MSLSRQLIRSLSVASLLCAPALASETQREPSALPEYTPVRWDEDYSYLKGTSGGDFFDRIKYIPMGVDDWYLSLGGQARLRYEYFNNEAFGEVENDWGYALQRYFFHVDAHFGDNIRAFAEFKSALVEDGRETPTTPRPTDADEVDVEQLFVDITMPIVDDSLTLRLGRQNLLYGAERLIGPNDWTNVRQTFEGAKLSYKVADQVTIDAFLVRPVTVETEEFNDGNGDSTFYGIYGSWNVPDNVLPGEVTADLYVLGLSNQEQFTGGTLDTDTYTAGARVAGNPKPFDYDIELDYQWGDFGIGSIDAYAMGAEVGYTFENATYTPRVFVGLEYGSGDDDPNDLTINTFNQLFPSSHYYYGAIDLVGRQNALDVHTGAEFSLAENQSYVNKLSLRADFHMFWRASDDSLYNAAGAQVRGGSAGESKYIGSEIDLLLNWQIDRHFAAYVGYSHFFAGDFIDESGSDDDIDYFYTAVTYTF